MEPKLHVTEATEDDLPFLLQIWNDPTVMRYAGSPEGRGWSESDIESWWRLYQREHSALGYDDTQLVLRLGDGTRVGESHFGPVPDGFCVGDWRKPDRTRCLMGDIKLLPSYWGRGLGTEGMRLVVQFVFTKTDCELFVVPPHERNPAAYRVYEKAGFSRTGVQAWPGHEIMELGRVRFDEVYDQGPRL